MAHLTVNIHDNIMHIQGQGFYLKFPDTGKNKKAIFAFIRGFSSLETGEPIFTFQEIADAFRHKARQNIENYSAEFTANEGDMQKYLSTKNAKHDRLCEPIAEQILTNPLLDIHQQYLAFLADNPDDALSEATFRKYARELDVLKLLKRVKTLFSQQGDAFDAKRYLREILEMDALSQAKRKEIVEHFPETQPSSSVIKSSLARTLSCPNIQLKLLVTLLYVCNVSQDVLSLLFGVSKTSIHRYIYAVCGDELNWQILGEIVQWSGQVSVDEKWIKIDGVWHFVLCAVDAVSGFPLLMDVYPTLDTVSWTLFFTRFHTLYGKPTLIQSDGSHSLAAARKIVFPGVRYQFCKCHKLKNLMKLIRQHVKESKRFRRAVRFAKHLFSNTWVSSRKQAAKSLQGVAGQEVSSYVEKHILASWRHVTMSLTNNASERFNRKIEKCFSGRYGIASVESAQVLLRGLWLKELVLNGHQHTVQTSDLASINLSKICQENLDPGKILHNFHDYGVSKAEKMA